MKRDRPDWMLLRVRATLARLGYLRAASVSITNGGDDGEK
jgi:hypothetical protein